MTIAPYRPCNRCKKRTREQSGYCLTCQERRSKIKSFNIKVYDKKRGSSASRGYDNTWRQFRRWKLNENPLCQCDRCKSMNRVKMATMVHHKKPIETHPELRLKPHNVLSMAFNCHEVEHGRARDYEWERRKR